MYKARKRNRVLRIPDEKIGEYKKMGYTITDEEGNTVYEPQDDKATIASLERENALLRQKLGEYELLGVKKTSEAAETEADTAPESETPKKSKATKTRAE